MKKVKIGIMTFHRSINYGAVMQSYALQQQIKTDFPNDDVEIIDYIPQKRFRSYKPTLRNYLFGSISSSSNLAVRAKIIIAKLFRLSYYSLIKKRYDAFQKSFRSLPLSQDFICTDDVEKYRKVISGKYDIIIVGSDCVWEWEVLGIPSAYYLSGDYGCHKFSYAACSGVNDYRSLDFESQTYLKDSFSAFDYIGVRDSATAYNVRELCPEKKVYFNCDPTTLINPDSLKGYRDYVKNVLTSKGVDWTKPVIGLMCNDIIGKLAYDIFGDTVQYVGVYAPNKYASIFLEDLKVLEWASIFGLFNLTFTTFFHGTMLSLVNKTPVLSFDYYDGDENHLTKIEELYKRLNLPGYYHKGKRNYIESEVAEIGNFAHYLIDNPQEGIISEKLKVEAESYNSFREALKSLHL